MSAVLMQFLKFALVGAVATAAHYAVMIVAVELGRVEPVLATLLGFSVGALVSYTLNRRFTFEAATAYGRGLAKFLLVIAIGAALNTAIVIFIIGQGLHYLIAQMIATLIVLVWNFAGSRLIVFRA